MLFQPRPRGEFLNFTEAEGCFFGRGLGRSLAEHETKTKECSDPPPPSGALVSYSAIQLHQRRSKNYEEELILSYKITL